jgi:hypothetical protein
MTSLKGLIVQVTGGKKDDSATKFIFQCFKTLKSRANFGGGELVQSKTEPAKESTSPNVGGQAPSGYSERGIGMNLSYTINLNLPASTDIAVFNAIFQSLRKNLLRDE